MQMYSSQQHQQLKYAYIRTTNIVFKNASF